MNLDCSIPFKRKYYDSLGIVKTPQEQEKELVKLFDGVFQEDIIPYHDLIKISIEYGIPAHLRPIVWKIAICYLPIYKEIWDFVQKEKDTSFNDIIQTYRVFQRAVNKNKSSHSLYSFNLIVSNADENDTGEERLMSHSNKSFSDTKENIRELINLFQVYHKEILGRNSSRLNSHKALLECIATSCVQVFPCSLSDQFWCFAEFIDLLEQGMDIIEPKILPEDLYEISIEELEMIIFQIIEHSLE